jgi:hypothetical protein
MTTVFNLAAPVMALIFFAACNSNSSSVPVNNTTETPAPPATVQLKDDPLNAVYQQYALLTTALINSDIAAARMAANAISVGAKEVTGGTGIGAAAERMTSATDIAVQRAAYAALSSDLILLIKKTGLNSGALYVDFCPMAMADKGAAWLSADKAIKNPYFGAQMMTCGDIKETIQ